MASALVQVRIGWSIRQGKCLGDSGICHLSVYYVESLSECGVFLKSLFPSLVRQLQSIWKRRVGERECRCAWYSTWHVCDSVVDDSVHDVGWVLVRCSMNCLDAATLIDGDVDDYRSWLHRLQILTTNESRCDGSRYENRSDDQIRGGDLLQDVMTIGIDECDVSGHDVGQVAQTFERQIQHGDLRPETRRHL